MPRKPKPPPTFADTLTRLRTEAGLTVAALAEKTGLSRTALYNLENGKNQPGLAVAQQIAAALGVSMTAFDAK